MNQQDELRKLVEKWNAGKFELDWHEAYIAKNKAASIKPLRYDAKRDWMKAIYQAGAEAALLSHHAVAEPQYDAMKELMWLHDEVSKSLLLLKMTKFMLPEALEEIKRAHRESTIRLMNRTPAHAAQQPKLTEEQVDEAVIATQEDWGGHLLIDRLTERLNALLAATVAPPPPQKETK